MGRGHLKAELHVDSCMELTAKIVEAMQPGSPGGTLITDEEGLGLLEHSRDVVTPQAHGLLLIQRAIGQLGVRGVEPLVAALEKNLAGEAKKHIGMAATVVVGNARAIEKARRSYRRARG